MANSRTSLASLALIILLALSNCTSDKSVCPPNQASGNLMVVYPNAGNLICLVDYSTCELVSVITVDIPDSLHIHRMCLSTDKQYFVFTATVSEPPFDQYIIGYDIGKDSVHNIFPTGLDSVGAPRLTAAHIPEEPGLIYFYSHSEGLYSIDFLSEEMRLISSECGQSLGKKFHVSPDERWIVINKYVPNYTELEFYDTSSGLAHPQFVLNRDDEDGINVKDMAFSEDNGQLYFSYLLSERRAVNEAAYFGSYDLETRRLNESRLTLPWSDNPYYMAYSPKREEAYLVGAQDKFYIVDTSSEVYALKAVVDLTGKVPSPSRILLRPDENVAFVSCIYSNLVIAIDLDERRILRRIGAIAPYLMLLL